VKILLDHNVPAYLAARLQGASTAYREGWHELSNGRLLKAAETAGFDLLVTRDRGFLSQQSMRGRGIAVAILEPVDQSRSSMEAVVQLLLDALPQIAVGEVRIIRPI